MKNIVKKYIRKDDSGIAIMFSLMMMSVFLVLGMGFSAYMTNIRRAAEYQKDFKVNKDIEEILKYQIRSALKGGFGVSGSYPDDGSSNTLNYTPSMPEASPARFDGQVSFTYQDDNDEVNMPDSNDNIEYALWGVETTESTHALDESDLAFETWIGETNTTTVQDIATNVFVNRSSFTSPNGGYLGWQEHQNENNETYAISTWALIGMSGRLDPTAYGDTTTSTSIRAAGENLSEMSMADIVTDTDSLAVIKSGGSLSLAAFHDLLWDPNGALAGQDGDIDDTTYFSFFPMGTKYTTEMLNESDVLTTTDKAMTTDSDAGNNVTLYNLTNAGTDLVSDIVSGIIYLPSDETGNQIAANIKDYVDNDDAITTDNANNPTYVGNEAVPQVNEIEVIVSVSFQDTNTDSYYDRSRINISLALEYVQLYEHVALNPGPTNITASYEYTDPDGDTVTGSATFNFSNSETFSSSIVSNTRAYYTSDLKNNNVYPIITNFDDGKWDVSTPPTLKDLKITFPNTIQISSSTSELWSIADLKSTTIPDLTTVGDTAEYILNVQCSEPKMNHISSNWNGTWSTIIGGGSSASTGTMDTSTATPTGEPNSNYVVANGDNEPGVTDPINLSTNYIRNGVILNLHELGYIHRGANHQTLNLIEYNTETPLTIGSYTSSNGDQLYASSNDFSALSNGGDRSILDYVTLDGNEETTPNLGRINPNTTHPGVLSMLFSNISADHPSGSGTRVGAGGTAIDYSSKILPLINNFPGINSSRTNRPFHDDANKVFPSIGYFDPLWFKNLKNNPPSYGIPFKLTSEINDREAEVLLCNTRRFVSVNRNYYIASLIVRDATAADSTSRLSYSTQTQSQQYIVRELIDDASGSSDSDRTPHDPSDDRYRIRIMREF